MTDKESLDKFINDLNQQIQLNWGMDSINQIVSLWENTTHQQPVGKSQKDIKSAIEQSSYWFADQTAHKIMDKYGTQSIPFTYQKNIYKNVVGVFSGQYGLERFDFKEEEVIRFFLLNSISPDYIPPSPRHRTGNKPNYILWIFFIVISLAIVL